MCNEWYFSKLCCIFTSIKLGSINFSIHSSKIKKLSFISMFIIQGHDIIIQASPLNFIIDIWYAQPEWPWAVTMYKYLNNKNNDDAFYQNILRKGIHTSHLIPICKKRINSWFYTLIYLPIHAHRSGYKYFCAWGTRQLFVKIKLNIIRDLTE